MSDFYVGQIIWAAFPDKPSHMEPCEGQLLPIAPYRDLFSVLGTHFGGNGQTTFGLPDLRGRTPLGEGVYPPPPAKAVKNYFTGMKDGAETVTLTELQIPSHAHVLTGTAQPGTAGYHNHIIASAGQNVPNNPYDIYALANKDLITLAGGNIGPVGGGASHGNMQPFLTLSAFIVINGIFPPRPNPNSTVEV